MRLKTCTVKDPEDPSVIRKGQNKDKGDPQNYGLLWEMKSHGNNLRITVTTLWCIKGWSPGQMFNYFWNLKVLIVLIDCGEIIQVGFSFLAGLAMRGNFLPAVSNLTGHRQRWLSQCCLSSGVFHTQASQEFFSSSQQVRKASARLPGQRTWVQVLAVFHTSLSALWNRPSLLIQKNELN